MIISLPSKLPSNSLWILLIIGWTLSIGGSHSQASTNEAEVKSAFIINILHYVRWSDNNSNKPREICVYYENPLVEFLENYARANRSHASPVFIIKQPSKLSELSSCDVVFISRSSAKELEQVIAIAKMHSILTISDIEHFAEKKGMVELVTKNNQIRLHINFMATKAAKLFMSSKLLELAEKVIMDKAT